MSISANRFVERFGPSLFAVAIGLLSCPMAHAQAQVAADETASPHALEDIVVTAQKRSQNLNDVGLSVQAISADAIASKGISQPEDLVRVVPGLTISRGQNDTPTYTLRGVGFFENSLSASPTVSMYIDQVPLPYPIMARGAPFDLERLEVLKGPQGTTFGQNSTGGLVNFIAAKPTNVLSAGLNVGYGRFGLFESNGFISGPIGEGISARLSAKTSQGGAWQVSATRPDDHLGDKRFSAARLIINADAGALRLSFNVNGWIDKSDTQAPQTIDPSPRVNGATPAPILDISREIQAAREGIPGSPTGTSTGLFARTTTSSRLRYARTTISHRT